MTHKQTVESKISGLTDDIAINLPHLAYNAHANVVRQYLDDNKTALGLGDLLTNHTQDTTILDDNDAIGDSIRKAIVHKRALAIILKGIAELQSEAGNFDPLDLNANADEVRSYLDRYKEALKIGDVLTGNTNNENILSNTNATSDTIKQTLIYKRSGYFIVSKIEPLTAETLNALPRLPEDANANEVRQYLNTHKDTLQIGDVLNGHTDDQIILRDEYAEYIRNQLIFKKFSDDQYNRIMQDQLLITPGSALYKALEQNGERVKKAIHNLPNPRNDEQVNKLIEGVKISTKYGSVAIALSKLNISEPAQIKAVQKENRTLAIQKLDDPNRTVYKIPNWRGYVASSTNPAELTSPSEAEKKLQKEILFIQNHQKSFFDKVDYFLVRTKELKHFRGLKEASTLEEIKKIDDETFNLEFNLRKFKNSLDDIANSPSTNHLENTKLKQKVESSLSHIEEIKSNLTEIANPNFVVTQFIEDTAEQKYVKTSNTQTQADLDLTNLLDSQMPFHRVIGDSTSVAFAKFTVDVQKIATPNGPAVIGRKISATENGDTVTTELKPKTAEDFQYINSLKRERDPWNLFTSIPNKIIMEYAAKIVNTHRSQMQNPNKPLRFNTAELPDVLAEALVLYCKYKGYKFHSPDFDPDQIQQKHIKFFEKIWSKDESHKTDLSKQTLKDLDKDTTYSGPSLF